MEKNHRFPNQSSSKGQLSESKKNQETSAKWPRQSKRREQPNTSGSNKPDNYRNTSSKASAGKTRNQTNYNYDKRSRQRPDACGEIGLAPDATASAPEPFDQFEEHYDGTGLVPTSGSGVAPPVRHELHSVFAPGSKKQSLNHLLNFHYAPRDRDQPTRLSKSGNIRCYTTKKISYNKEQFLQANCQFVVRSGKDYSAFLASPDYLVDWSRIEQIHVLSAEEPQCPICLYPPVAAKMTKCGHVYCWPCILHYLALSDKTWRKCPICYEAIHLPDLRSAVTKSFHSYSIGEFVTFQLMRREKTSMFVGIASENGMECTGVPRFDAKSGNNIMSKLLVATIDEILGIIDREQQELLNQIVLDGADCPENIFVQQALDQLEERKRDISNKKSEKITESQPSNADGNSSVKQAQDGEISKTSLREGEDFTLGRPLSSQDFLIDEDSNFSLSDIDIVPTQQCATSNYYYFYQSTDGQPLYLHSLNTRMLQTMYGGLDKSPHRITGKVIQKDSCSLSEDLRKRLKYLQHLPICTQFDVIEVEFEPDVVSSDVFAQFKDEINKRKKDRQKRARAERIRERQIFEFNERQLGKSMTRSARIPIDSSKHFPSCGNVDHFDFSRDPALGSSPNTDVMASPNRTSVASSWSKMLSTSQTASRWPSLPTGGSLNTPEPLAAPTPKIVQITGSNVTVESRFTQQRFTPESDDDENDGDFERNRAREYCNNLSFAIEAALEKATLNHGESATPETSKIKSKFANGVTAASTGSKKKKNKKTLLFASGMNLN